MKNKLFRFQWSKDTSIALGSGVAVLLLSLAMNLFPDSPVMSILLRDVLMIFLLGFCFPLYFTCIKRGEKLAVLGIHREKLALSLVLNVVFACALLAMFLKGNTQTLSFTRNTLFAVFYIFAAGIFEMVFLYGFLRAQFERAFGTIPAIVLTAVFYSLHHAGFQPEFGKLFLVGILYVSVFYLTRNLFVIFPFFWGIGAVWDVLVNSTAGNQLTNVRSFAVSMALFVLMAAASVVLYRKRRALDTAECK